MSKSSVISDIMNDKSIEVLYKKNVLEVLLTSEGLDQMNVTIDEAITSLESPMVLKDIEGLFLEAQGEYEVWLDANKIIVFDYNLTKLELELTGTNINVVLSGEILSNDILKDIRTRYSLLSSLLPSLRKSSKKVSIVVEV